MTGRQSPRFSDPPRKNDALFLYGALRLREKPFVYAYRQEATEVIHGPSCIPEKEIALDRCASDGIPVWRRRTGGGTVVLSRGVVVTVIVGERSGTKPAPWYFDGIHDAMISLLAGQGITGVARNGISDLACNNRKILGSSLYLGTRPPLYYYQSSLLVDADLSLMSRYLHHPPREPHYRMMRPHHAFCTSLAHEGYAITPEETAQLFNDQLSSLLQSGCTTDTIIKEP